MVLRVKWLLIFGGIALFAVVLYALLGVWLWRRTKALLIELGEAAQKLESAFPEVQDDDRRVGSDQTRRGEVGAGAGQKR